MSLRGGLKKVGFFHGEIVLAHYKHFLKNGTKIHDRNFQKCNKGRVKKGGFFLNRGRGSAPVPSFYLF